MKIIISLGFLLITLSSCGQRETSTKQETASPNSTSAENTNAPLNTETTEKVETYELTPKQAEIAAKGKEIKWDEQNISWKVPVSWKKISSTPTKLEYSSGDGAFLPATISPVADGSLVDVLLKASYRAAEIRKQAGHFENLRYLELDGTRGIEYIEMAFRSAPMPRQLQWLGFRKHNGQAQRIIILMWAKIEIFEKKRDEFAAIMSSTKLAE